jgi:hypothetical protein
MKKTLIASLFLFAACAASPTDSTSAQRSIIDMPCAADTDCPTGFECEVEVEHGTTSSFCQASEPSDDATGGCPAGFELEVEHGQNFCVPHGGSGGGAGSGSGGGSDDGAGHV